MAVAEKLTTETPQRTQHQQVIISSALAALYVIACGWLLFNGLPSLWRALDLAGLFAGADKKPNEFLAESLLILVWLPTVFGAFVLGLRLEGPHPTRGMRAGAAYLCLSFLAGFLMLTSGSPLWAAIGIAVLIGAGVLLIQPGFTAWLARCEDAGWFHGTTYKPNQGLRVRRATVLALVILVACGIWTLIKHGSLYTGEILITRPLFGGSLAPATDPWIGYVPFADESFVFLYRISLTIPLLLMVVSAWIAWRVVNWPAFADFLIATEAEMNKVSWTTRKRLYQDTIVVLVTVVLFTLFLFVIDILWIKILTNPVIDVLKHDPAEAARKNQQSAQW
jgi:preprotein translocase SecE subunit